MVRHSKGTCRSSGISLETPGRGAPTHTKHHRGVDSPMKQPILDKERAAVFTSVHIPPRLWAVAPALFFDLGSAICYSAFRVTGRRMQPIFSTRRIVSQQEIVNTMYGPTI